MARGWRWSACLLVPTSLALLMACGGGGSSSPSGSTGSTPGATADAQAPGVPSGLTATTVSSRSVTLTWTAATDNVAVSGYDVLRDGVVVGSVSAATLSYSEAALASDTSYSYAVRAKDAAGNLSAASTALPVTTSGWPVLGGDPGVSAYRSVASASAFYVDATNGNDANDGRSSAKAWKTLDRLHSQKLGPGDVVRLARGSVWSRQNLYLDEGNGSAGTAVSPVIFEAYGTGQPPTIADPRALWDKTKPFPAVVLGSTARYITILDLRIQDGGEQVGVALSKSSEGIVIGHLEILRCGTGIDVAGKNQKILSCYIHDINRSNSGIGIGFLGSNLEFAWNRLTRCVTIRSDGHEDGSPFEYYGRNVNNQGVETFDLSDNIQIHHNRVDDCLNFIEGYGNATNLVIAYNLYVNSPANPLIMHLDDSEHATWTHECTYDMRVENNTFVPNREADPGGWGAYGLLVDWNHSADPAKSRMVVRNNLLVTNYTALSWINPLGANLVHDHNQFFFLDKGKLCTNAGIWVQDATEILKDPQFADAAHQDYRLTAASPGIGKGAPASYAVDLAGTPVPAGAAADIGAFQYVP